MSSEKYNLMQKKLDAVNQKLSKPFTLIEKIIYSHLHENQEVKDFKSNQDYILLEPDRLAMQDATGQMALLQFMNTGREKVALPASVHCDHLITAREGADSDLQKAQEENKPVYDFLRSASQKYGIDYWRPGSGIIHQIILENYAQPGGLMLGTDSHTPNCGGMGMMGVGVGGADAVDIMVDLPWELQMPKIFGVKLTGELNDWTAPKDVILYILDILGAKGATNAVLEYFGPGTETLSATGKATITNMGAETGATTSVFPFDKNIYEFLQLTNREEIAEAAAQHSEVLKADSDVYEAPHQFYDKVIEINLSEVEPYINGPFTPDAAFKVSDFDKVEEKTEAPAELSVGLVGSCTNSSYEDLKKVSQLLEIAKEKGLELESDFLVNPGSEWVREICEEEGVFDIIRDMGGTIFANACGPCIGQWDRNNDNPDMKNTILTSFNRNFKKRNDGNPYTYAFLASPEMVTAQSLAGRIDFNPDKDKLPNKNGDFVVLEYPESPEWEQIKPSPKIDDNSEVIREHKTETEINIDDESDRVEMLDPFEEWKGEDLENLQLLIKTKGKCTTDHISQAGEWLYYRGNLDKISDNLLLGANNAFYESDGYTKNELTDEYEKVPKVARDYKEIGVNSFIVAEDNYGEGSSREHAAMEPRYMGVRAVIAKSFARIHETNLKKQGVLALTFKNNDDYDKFREDDTIDIKGLADFAPGEDLKVIIDHAEGGSEEIKVEHTYSEMQIEWFKEGSAINWINKNR